MGERYAGTAYTGQPYADKVVDIDYGGVAYQGPPYATVTVDNGDYASKLFTDTDFDPAPPE